MFRVLYVAEQRLACFVEMLAAFRLDVALLASLAQITGSAEPLPVPRVPSDWYARRKLGRLSVAPGQRWLDLRAPETLQTLRVEMAAVLAHLGLPDLDVSATRGPSRDLTRQIARWAFEQGFHGLAYRSRFADHFECRAVFEGASITPVRPDEAIVPDDPDFQAAAALLGLTIER